MTSKSLENAVAIWQAGVAAVAADRLVAEHLDVICDHGLPELVLGDCSYELQPIDRLLVIGAGKAGASMAAGFERKLQHLMTKHPQIRRLQICGLLNVPSGTVCPLHHIRLIEARPAGINEPTPQGVAGSQEMLRLVREADQRTGCIVLLSGGGSALLPLPITGIGLEEKLLVTRALSSAGASINELNTVRKHLSAIKGGKLAAACRARWLHTFVISDVLGDPLDLIASGPTVPDTSTASDALEILRRFDPDCCLPDSVYRVLEQQASNGHHHEVALRAAQITVIGNNAVAVDAAGIEAEKLGYNHAMLSARTSEGMAEALGKLLAKMAVSMLSGGPGSPNCLITGGEPVVRLVVAEKRGKGGRNQQLVLAALQHWMHEPDDIQRELKRRVTMLSGGTDGEDGPTDAAGAFINGQVWTRAESLGLNPTDFLDRNDAYTFFQRTGGLLITGPTGTNVCDIRVVTID